MSHKIVITGTGASATATVTDAKIVDILTTAISTDSAVTGTYGLIQKAALFLGGMSVQNKRKTNSFNPFA